MENLAEWMREYIGKVIVFFDNEGRRYEGKLERVLGDYFQVFELKQRLSKVFKFDIIKEVTIKK